MAPVALLLLWLVAGAEAEAGPGPEPEPPAPPVPVEAADTLFAAGAAAYARGDWAAVILHMERALRARAALRARLRHCRLRCANAAAAAWPEPAAAEPAALRDLGFFGALLRRAACLRACGPAAPSRLLLAEELELEFRKRSPYNYLQVAYFKVRGWRGEGCLPSPPARRHTSPRLFLPRAAPLPPSLPRSRSRDATSRAGRCAHRPRATWSPLCGCAAPLSRVRVARSGAPLPLHRYMLAVMRRTDRTRHPGAGPGPGALLESVSRAPEKA